jgi:hypothetical protein
MKLILNYKKPIYKDNKIVSFKKIKEYKIENTTKRGGDIFDNLRRNIDFPSPKCLPKISNSFTCNMEGLSETEWPSWTSKKYQIGEKIV